MSREERKGRDEGQQFNDLGDPLCPQCGSEDTAPIHQEPMWASNDEPDPTVKDPPWYRCLTCRHKWRTDLSGGPEPRRS